MLKLTDKGIGRTLWCGTAFRVAKFSDTNRPVLLMILSMPDREFRICLIEVGGYSRGELLLVFPEDAYFSGQNISRSWLVKNWKKWVDPYSDSASVEVIPDLLAVLPDQLDGEPHM